MAEEEGVVRVVGAPAAAQIGSLDARGRTGGASTLCAVVGSMPHNQERADGFR